MDPEFKKNLQKLSSLYDEVFQDCTQLSSEKLNSQLESLRTLITSLGKRLDTDTEEIQKQIDIFQSHVDIWFEKTLVNLMKFKESRISPILSQIREME
jgi:flagellar biosynthesis chaperone FliJ